MITHARRPSASQLTTVVALGMALLVFKPGTARPQDTSYVPSKESPNGRQVVAVYFGAHWCKPCMVPDMKAAIRRMKLLVAAQARDSGAAFSAIVDAFDRNLDTGLAFVRPLGAFDEYSFGDDITSLTAERFIWGDSLVEKGLPTLVVFERTVHVAPHTAITFSPVHVLLRLSGDAIVPWVQAGAPIWTREP